PLRGGLRPPQRAPPDPRQPRRPRRLLPVPRRPAPGPRRAGLLRADPVMRDLLPSPPPLPETPLEALGPPVRHRVLSADRAFLLSRRTAPARLLDHPAVRSAFAADEYMPYWADLWPAARMLAKYIVRQSWAPGLRALEVGCGLGLPGIAGLAMGLRVT